jgi:LPS-assembly protein
MRYLILSFIVSFALSGIPFHLVAAQTSSPTTSTTSTTTSTSAGSAREDRLKILPNEPLTIRAESLERDADRDLYIIEGDVEIKYRDVRLRADRVELNDITGDLVAIGEVVYEEGSDVLRAERAEFNINSELGIVYKGDAAIQPDQYLTGERIEKIGEKSFKIDKGSFTACSSHLPFWKFKSSDATVHKGDYFIGKNILLFIQGIPLLFTPYLIFPIKEERQTGFLIPDFGSSRSKGFRLNNTFFWAISESQDFTFAHTYYDLRGNEFSSSYRYIYSANTRGTISGRYIRDSKDNDSDRGDFRLGHRQSLPWDIEALGNVNLVSDTTFLRDFDNRLEERTRQTAETNIAFTKRFAEHSIRFFSNRLESLTPSTSTTVATDQIDTLLPELRFTSLNQRVFTSPFFFQQETVFSSFHRETSGTTQLEFSRLDINPILSLPVKLLGRALTFTPSVNYRETWYTDDATTSVNPALEGNSISRELFGFNVVMNGPKFDKIFDRGEDQSVTKLKHIIEPGLVYGYIQRVDQNNLPSIDGIDRISGQNQLTYSLSNRLLAKRKVKPKEDQEVTATITTATGDSEVTPQFETKEIISLALSQGVSFTQPDFRFSNITATLQVFQGSPSRLQVVTAYDPYVSKIVTNSVDLYTNYKDKFNLTVLWRRDLIVDRATDAVISKTQFLDLQTSAKLWNTFGISYRTRFNIEDQERVEDFLQVAYNAQCWSLVGDFGQQRITTGSINLDRRFLITLEFKHLGKIGTLRF